MQSLSGGLGRRHWRQTDATMDVESLGDVSVSSSVERQAMREQLDAVRHTLNALATAAQPGVNAMSTGFEGVLSDISTKLSSIEGLYAGLTSKLEKVDVRVEDSERHIKDLQHLSASAIHETARLVDHYAGARGTPVARPSSLAGAGPSGLSPAAGLRGRHIAPSGVPVTPPPAGLSPARNTMPAHEYVPGHLTATIQQHATQIHKLIAGLDFLEAHIIRQDQAVEGVQKQLLSVARDVATASAVAESRTSPSELSLRIHDMGELLNKLRAHMYKVEKKTSNNDQALVLLTQRIQVVEQSTASAGRGQQREATDALSNPTSEIGPSLGEIAASHEELRSMVQDLCRDVLELRDQVQAQPAGQAPRGPEQAVPGVSAEEGAEMRRQLAYLMSQVPALLMENKELKDFAARATTRIDDLSSALDQHKDRAQQPNERATAAAPVGDNEAASAAANVAVTELQATVSSLREQMGALESRLQGAATRGDVEALSTVQGGLAAVRADVIAVQEKVSVLQRTNQAWAEEAAASRAQLEALSAAVQALSASQGDGEPQSPPIAAAVVARVSRIKSGSPEAAVLASQVSAAAKADLEEQFGQLRHRIGMATAVAEAAEEAARRSAEAAAVAAATLEKISQADSERGSSLKETVVAMVAGVEQEQTIFKQQLAELAAQVCNDQAAISSGLQQVQDQVAAAAAAATEAVACAQAVQRQQQQENGGQQEQQSVALRAVQAELREQVASVMERLKHRVEEGMQQMATEVGVLSDRVSGAATSAQLEAALERLRASAADSSERAELAAASLEELRAELILLTGQQDVVQSRLLGLESIVGVDVRSSPLGQATESVTIPPTIEEDESEGQDSDQDAAEDRARGLRPSIGALSVLPTVGSLTSGGRGLLDLVAELQSRVGGLDGALEAAAADMDQLRDLYQSNVERTQDTIQQATAQLVSDLQGLSAIVDECAANNAASILAMETATAAIERKVADQVNVTSELAARAEELQLRLESEVLVRMKETSAAVSSLSSRIARDYVNREQLGAIFQARADMKRAVDELATVFSTGRLLRTASNEEADGGFTEPEGGAQRTASGTLSPRLVAALEDLAGKQAELEHQVQLALYRTESAVRQEQLAGIQQAMMTLELQFRRLGTVGAQSALQIAQQASDAVFTSADASANLPTQLSVLRERIDSLEAGLAAVKAPATTTSESNVPPAVLGDEAALSSAPSGKALRISLTQDDTADANSPIRLRLLHAEQPMDASCAVGEVDAAAREQPLCSMPDAVPQTVSMGVQRDVLKPRTAGEDDEEGTLRRQLQELAQQCEALRSQMAADCVERERLAEALTDLQDRLDMQVNATASTAAMVATMATDQPQQQVRFQVRVGMPESQDLAALATTVATLASRVEAAEESLASAFVVRTPRSPTRAIAAAAAAAAQGATVGASDSQHGGSPGPSDRHAEPEGGTSSDEDIRPALGVMVPVMPRQVEQQIAGLQAAQQKLEASIATLVGRIDGLEAVDALEEVRAVASEAVLDAIPGMVAERVAVVREEMSALLSRQAEELLALASQATRDTAEAVQVAQEAAAEAAAARDAVTETLAMQAAATDDRNSSLRAVMEAAENAAAEAAAHAAAAREAATAAAAAREGVLEAQAAAQAAADEAEKAADAASATASAREAALDVAMSVAREVAEEAAREAAAKSMAGTGEGQAPRDEELVGSVVLLTSEMKGIRGAVHSLTERMNDVDTLRDQLETLAAQVRDSMTSPSAEPAEISANTGSQGPPSTPTAVAVASIFTPAATALVIPPAHTPRAGAAGAVSPSPPGARTGTTPQPPAVGSQQAAFLARLVAVVKRQSSRLHAQYSDAEETGAALAQVDSTLEEAEARLADVRDANSPAFAETLVTVLEQVAALRYIGSQTHPAVQQMVLEHENRLGKISEELKALGGGSPMRAGPRPTAGSPAAAVLDSAIAEEVSSLSKQVARMEAELTRVAGQQTALDRAVKDVLAVAGSVRMGSAAGSSVTDLTNSRRVTSQEGFAGEEAPIGATTVDEEIPLATGLAGEEAAVGLAAAFEAAGLTAQVRLLEDTLAVQLSALRQELMAEIRARAGSGGGAATVATAMTAAELSALEKTVSQQHSALTLVRNRVLVVQEYVDSTQGMIKDMHVAVGTLHRRVDTLEAQLGPGSRSARVSGSGTSAAASGSIRELQADLSKFERRLLAVESSTLDAAHALADLKGLAPRMSETETRVLDVCSKVAVAFGGSASSTAPIIPAVAGSATLPALSAAVRSLEKRLGGREEAACNALDALASALSAAGRIQAESTANPFKAISAAVNNPVMVAMEKKLETVRAEILVAATCMQDDMRRDLQQSQLDNRIAASADVSVSGGSTAAGSRP